MSKNRHVPREIQRYVVITKTKNTMSARYFHSQKEAKAAFKDKPGKNGMFRINYDYYGDI